MVGSFLSLTVILVSKRLKGLSECFQWQLNLLVRFTNSVFAFRCSTTDLSRAQCGGQAINGKFNPSTPKSEKHLHVTSPYKITPKLHTKVTRVQVMMFTK